MLDLGTDRQTDHGLTICYYVTLGMFLNFLSHNSSHLLNSDNDSYLARLLKGLEMMIIKFCHCLVRKRNIIKISNIDEVFYKGRKSQSWQGITKKKRQSIDSIFPLCTESYIFSATKIRRVIFL